MGPKVGRIGLWVAIGVIVSFALGAAGVLGVGARGPEGGGEQPQQGTAWKRHALTGSGLLGVDAVAPNDAWAVGSDGLLAHWNGLNWSAYDSKLGVAAV